MKMSTGIARTFLNGLAVTLPIAITAALIWWFASSIESLLGSALRWVLPGSYYIPGLGICVGILLILLVGLAMRIWLARNLVQFGIHLLERIPVVRSVLSGIRDLMLFVQKAASSEQDLGKVVLVEFAPGVQLLGFLTDGSNNHLDAAVDNKTAVYLQMSYQMGGYTVFVDSDKVRPVDIPFEEAMRWGYKRRDVVRSGTAHWH